MLYASRVVVQLFSRHRILRKFDYLFFRFRSAVAEFLTERLQAFKPIDPNNVSVTDRVETRKITPGHLGPVTNRHWKTGCVCEMF